MSFTLADPIRHHAAQRPNSPALTFGNTTLTYGELCARSERVAAALTQSGVGPGDRVAVLSKNAPAFYEIAFGASMVGAVMAGLNWRLAPAEISAIVADAEPTVIVVADDQRPLLEEATLAVASIRTVISLDRDYEAWLADASSEALVETAPNEDDVVLLLYTSGTTGVPKGVELTNRGMSYCRQLSADVWGFTADSVNLVGMPMFHIGGIGYGMSAFVSGGHTVLLRDLDTPTIVSAIERHRVSHAFFVPAVIQSVVQSPGIEESDLSSLQLLCYGASPIGESVLRRAIEVIGCNFTQAFGMTETSGTVVSLPPADHDPDGDRAALLRSCGVALPWVELGVFDPSTAQRVVSGEVGEVWVRSPMNMRGYRNKPEETARTITTDGWLRTGDAAYLNDEGYVFLFDRYKDMIVSGAENIYPAEIENVLYRHLGVAEAAVIGVPHERWGETPKAIVVMRPGHSADEAELIELCRQHLARYKCPTSVEFRVAGSSERSHDSSVEPTEFVTTIPRNASGKVLKKDLRAPYWVGHERHIG
jgi:acyl-CoA synthetase (AMP-forming)/AMP-acid ligase II